MAALCIQLGLCLCGGDNKNGGDTFVLCVPFAWGITVLVQIYNVVTLCMEAFRVKETDSFKPEDLSSLNVCGDDNMVVDIQTILDWGNGF